MSKPKDHASNRSDPNGPESSADAQLRLALLEDGSGPYEIESLPARLARAAAHVLKVDGVGIGVIDDYFRVPLGSSDDTASHAERLQFTTGEGPCLEAVRTKRSVAVDAEQMQARWPLFASQLFDRTPYQAVMSLPLGDAAMSLGALDLYLVDPAGLASISAVDAIAVVEEIHKTLVLTAAPAPGPLSGTPEPRWMHGDLAQSRMAVWIAVGEIMTAFDVVDPDALDLLRAYAYSHSETVDEIARMLNDGELTVDQFTP